MDILARACAQAQVVQSDSALNEALARICWLDADSSAPAYTIEQLVGIADRRHAQGREQSFVELTRGTKVAHAQYDMRHAVNLDFGIRHNQSPCYGTTPRSGTFPSIVRALRERRRLCQRQGPFAYPASNFLPLAKARLNMARAHFSITRLWSFVSPCGLSAPSNSSRTPPSRRRRAAECGQQFPPSDGDCHTPLPCEVRKGR